MATGIGPNRASRLGIFLMDWFVPIGWALNAFDYGESDKFDRLLPALLADSNCNQGTDQKDLTQPTRELLAASC